MRAPLLLPLLTICAAACGGDATGRPAAQRIDSAGVPVVVNAAPDSTSPMWRLSAAPLFEIGAVDGPPEVQLFRAATGAVLTDGTIVIANGGTQELRLYDQAGTHLRTVGGQGEGPGQFVRLSLLGTLRGDSLLAWDQQQRRFSVFGADGTYARGYQGPPELGPIPTPVGVLSDGSVVAVDRRPGGLTGGAGVMRSSANVVRVGPDGAPAEPLGAYPGLEESVFEGFGMGVIFGRGLHVHARGDRIAVGNDDTYSVRVHGSDGSLLHVVRLDRTPLTVGADDFASAAPPTIPGSPLQGRMTGALEQMPRHATFPAFSALELGPDGRLWVRDFARPGAEGEVWHAFDADGAYVARLDLPPGADVLDFGADQVLVRTRDELEVERVGLYRLEGR